MKTSVLAVLGNDGSGIIAGVTGILYKTQCNLEDVSMTVLENEFAMLVVVSFDPFKKKALDQKLSKFCSKRGLTFFWKEMSKPKGFAVKKNLDSNLYLISAVGRDRTGIVYHISRDIAAEKLNIQDLNSKILSASQKVPVYAMVLEVLVPKRYKITVLERRLKKTAAMLKIDLTIKPIEQLEL